MKYFYDSDIQRKNLAWFLPRPKPDHYKGGMPLYAEKWLLNLAGDILNLRVKDGFRVLNLFCGMNEDGLRIDINPEVNPDFCVDAHQFTRHIPGKSFQIILADPPYSDEENEHLYSDCINGDMPKLNYKKWTNECDKVLELNGLLIVYHKFVMPNPNPKKYKVVKIVFIGNRTYHLPRVAIYFQKIG